MDAEGGLSTWELSRKGDGRVGILIGAGFGISSSVVGAAVFAAGAWTGKEKGDFSALFDTLDASKTKLFEGVVELVDLTEFPASGVPITLPPNEKPFVGTVGGPSGLGLGCAAAGADPNEKPANGAGLDAVAEEVVGRLG